MKYTSSVTTKGQATIPASIRKSLGIKPNTKIVFEIKDNNEVTIKPVQDFFALKGSVKSDKPFNLNSMEKAIKDAVLNEYAKKSY
jgi:antitoxin PrlF